MFKCKYMPYTLGIWTWHDELHAKLRHCRCKRKVRLWQCGFSEPVKNPVLTRSTETGCAATLVLFFCISACKLLSFTKDTLFYCYFPPTPPPIVTERFLCLPTVRPSITPSNNTNRIAPNDTPTMRPVFGPLLLLCWLSARTEKSDNREENNMYYYCCFFFVNFLNFYLTCGMIASAHNIFAIGFCERHLYCASLSGPALNVHVPKAKPLC